MMTVSDTTDAKIYPEEFLEIARDGVPYVGQLGIKVEAWEAGHVQLRLPFSDLIRRPGGTICGPALMGLADVTLYGVVMSLLGRSELAVTTDLTFHFLSKPEPLDVLAEGRILKLGRRLAVGEVTITSDGRSQLLCQAVGSYSIPPTID
ncbi:MAG: PaaI family thioesterase [Geminicoccaceae bacterium]